MQEAGEQAGDGGMVALLGAGAAEHAAELADAHGLSVANDNSPGQVVLSGPAPRWPRPPRPRRAPACARWSSRSPGAFHSPMMASAVPEFEAALAEVEVSPRPRHGRSAR